MKKLLVTRYLLCSFLFLGLSKVSYSQTGTQPTLEMERHSDEIFKNNNVTGVGTKDIVYHLGKAIEPSLLQDCSNFIQKNRHIVHFTISDTEIKMEYAEVVNTNEQLYLFLQRLEMYYMYKPKHSL